MALVFYNTLSRSKEEFVPQNPPKVGLYVCGVTVYDYSHIGHARTFINFDVIYRYLVYKGFDVTYVRNFTDIDDKIIKRANELGITTGELTEKFIAAFSEDMEALGLIRPHVEPHCTDYVPKMVDYVRDLVDKGYAYPAANGDVFYRVGRFNGYGKLSGKNIEDLQSGARVEVNDQKEAPVDFVLWKASKPGEPKWDSPWGEGRPGWHIECSVMSQDNIGETLDIHGGGKDLMFPHHENEIAQSEAHNGVDFAKYWIHAGHLNVASDGDPEGVKMSKSLGNFFTIRDVLAVFHPQTVRFFMLSQHYRSDLIFSHEGLSKAQDRLAYFYQTLAKADEFLAAHPATGDTLLEPERVARVIQQFEAAMDDDVNTQRAFGQLSGVFKWMNELANGKHGEGSEVAATLKKLRKDVATIANVIGLFDLDPADFERQLKEIALKSLDIEIPEIEAAIVARREARDNKDFAKADQIRDDLAARGILLKDSPQGTEWLVKG